MLILQRKQSRTIKTILFALIVIALSGVRAPIPARASGYAAKQQMSPARFPEITAKNAAQLTRVATITAPDDDSFTNPIWSPDGKYLLVSGLYSNLLFDTSNFASAPRLINQEGAPTFSPDGALLAIASYGQDSSIYVYKVASGKQLYVVPNGIIRLFSPDSSLLAVSDDQESTRLLDARTGKTVTVLPGYQYNLAFSPDSSMLATVEEERFQEAVAIWDPMTGERETGFRINHLSATNLAFSPSGEAIAVMFLGGNIIVFDVWTGEQLHRFSPSYQDFANLSFSPDGMMLAAFGPGKTYLWNLTTGSSSEFDYDYDLYGGTFNKDGSLLLYWDADDSTTLPVGNNLRVWSIPEHRQLLLLEDARDPEFSPDGTMLATWGSSVVIWAVQQPSAIF